MIFSDYIGTFLKLKMFLLETTLYLMFYWFSQRVFFVDTDEVRFHLHESQYVSSSLKSKLNSYIII
jgi:hypothetical protein